MGELSSPIREELAKAVCVKASIVQGLGRAGEASPHERRKIHSLGHRGDVICGHDAITLASIGDTKRELLWQKLHIEVGK